MRQATVVYHHESNTWWSESADLPGFSAAADTFTELRRLTEDGASLAFDGEGVELTETFESGAVLTTSHANVRHYGAVGVADIKASLRVSESTATAPVTQRQQ